MRRPLFLAAAGAAASLAALGAYRLVLLPWYRTWGVEPAEKGRLLPGDELLAAPSGVMTRGITIDAPAPAIWPWLVQMGYGRAGWYSYDVLDMRGHSAREIVPEWQHLAAADVVPTHPAGGFEVAQVEPDHALVLYIDDTIVERQRLAAESRAGEAEKIPAGLAVSGAILGTQPTKFRASWAFVLEPIGGEQTRLIERFRVLYPETGPIDRLTGPLMGFGVFVMMRRQMLGLKERAEHLIDSPTTPPVEPEPAPAKP